MGEYKSHLESNSFRKHFTTHFLPPRRGAEDSGGVAELAEAPLPVQVRGVDASGACSAMAVAHTVDAVVHTDDIDTADNTAEHQVPREALEGHDIPVLRTDVRVSLRGAFPVVDVLRGRPVEEAACYHPAEWMRWAPALQERLLEVQLGGERTLVAVVDVVGVVVIVVVVELHMLDEAAGERMEMGCSRY